MKSLANRNCAEVRNPMNKENVNQSTVDIFCEKKELEKYHRKIMEEEK